MVTIPGKQPTYFALVYGYTAHWRIFFFGLQNSKQNQHIYRLQPAVPTSKAVSNLDSFGREAIYDFKLRFKKKQAKKIL